MIEGENIGDITFSPAESSHYRLTSSQSMYSASTIVRRRAVGVSHLLLLRKINVCSAIRIRSERHRW